MKILIVNDGAGDGGGVETYLRSVASSLGARGHELVFGYCVGEPSGMAPHVSRCIRLDARTDRLVPTGWGNDGFDLCFSHNMRFLDVERLLLGRYPVVKFMHGYFGTCVSGLKSTSLGHIQTCQRRFSARCLAHYFIRGCGQRTLGACFSGYHWAREQLRLLSQYAAVVVASGHMREEYMRHGVQPTRITSIPLFGDPPDAALSVPAPAAAHTDSNGRHRLVFIGRMTSLKGPQLLAKAVVVAMRKLGRKIQMDFIGDGPLLASCKEAAQKDGIEGVFHGWLEGEAKLAALDGACGLVMPSLWPEPFGLVGLECARFGIPSAAFDVGGISEWLHDGANGILAKSDPPTAESMGDAIVDLIRDESKWLGFRSGAMQMASDFTLDRHARRLLSVLEQVRN